MGCGSAGAHLGTASGVLGRSASNEFGVALLELFVDAHVLLFCQDGVVGLQAVLLEELFIPAVMGKQS